MGSERQKNESVEEIEVQGEMESGNRREGGWGGWGGGGGGVFFFQAEDGIRDTSVTGVQTCALPI